MLFKGNRVYKNAFLYQVNLYDTESALLSHELREKRVCVFYSVQCILIADDVLGSPEFNFSAALVNSQLICLPPVGILNSLCYI